MAVMGLRLAQRANGVGQLHGEVSRRMFNGLWPGFDADRGADHLGHQRRARADLGRPARCIDLARRDGRAPSSSTRRRGWEPLEQVADDEIWAMRRDRCATRLVDEARRRLRDVLAAARAPATAELGWIDDVLDPDVLTIGFARRVPSYKRLTLMLRDPERLTALLLRPGAPGPDRRSPASRTPPTTAASG